MSSGVEDRGEPVRRANDICSATGFPHSWSGVLTAKQLSKLEGVTDIAPSEFADHVACETCGVIKIIHFDK